MRTALILIGSSDRDGFTEALSAEVAEGLSQSGDVADIVRLSELDIGHCRDCGKCRSGRCVQDDGMTEIYRMAQSADGIVFATPVHFETPSSLSKTAIDRFQRYWYSPEAFDGTSVSMIICGGRRSPRFESVAAAGKSLAYTIGADWKESFTLAGTDGFDELPPEAAGAARRFGAEFFRNGNPE
jgi:multimeric flavodoxin WrbA